MVIGSSDVVRVGKIIKDLKNVSLKKTEIESPEMGIFLHVKMGE